ncbi:uncharacterized protein LOC143295049 [Babylonia areolata]|uniref:uncharacterized protein LOC143291313 n=1 Tax=Babylonia areolata TaxID=304850 RepID=UPI003FD21599
MRGKRGCALKLAFVLHVLGFVALLAGIATPYWSGVEDGHEGLLVSITATGQDWAFRDFNVMKKAGSSEAVLYLTVSVWLGVAGVLMEFFLLEAFAMALCNASCGKRYNPDWLMLFSLLAGLTAITSLAMFEQYTGRSFQQSTDVKTDISRGLVIVYIAAVFLSTFLTVCDRSAHSDSNNNSKK